MEALPGSGDSRSEETSGVVEMALLWTGWEVGIRGYPLHSGFRIRQKRGHLGRSYRRHCRPGGSQWQGGKNVIALDSSKDFIGPSDPQRTLLR